jgi:hypothetical protein
MTWNLASNARLWRIARFFVKFFVRFNGLDVPNHLWLGDMFSCCSTTEENLDLDESAETLGVLLRLLHSPPPPPIRVGIPLSREHERLTSRIHIREYEPGSVVPLPMLPMLLSLADKYVLKDSIVSSLHEHLLANASAHPLQVYGMATRHGLDRIASAATKYLLHPPLSSYTVEDVKVIGSAEGYHKLLLLHAYRVKRLREILLAEEVFPHGYGVCPTHGQRTTSLWARSRDSIAPKMEAGRTTFYYN